MIMENFDVNNSKCGITVHFNVPCFLQAMLRWLRNSAEVPQEYLDKILVARKSTWKSLQLEFDESVNCFEVIQKIKQSSLCALIRVVEISSSRGRFVEIRRNYSVGDNITDLYAIAKEIKQYGEILKLAKCRIEGICTGNIKAVMLVQDDSKLLDKEWLKAARIYQVKPFFATDSNSVAADQVKELWEKYGPKNENDVSQGEVRLALCDKHKMEENRNNVQESDDVFEQVD